MIVLWYSQITNDRHMHSNKTDIMIWETETKKCLLINVAMPSDYSIQKKTTEKMSKYVDLQVECKHMWNEKVEVVPVIIDATGLVQKNLKKHLSRIPGKCNIYNLWRSAILGTVHILRKYYLPRQSS